MKLKSFLISLRNEQLRRSSSILQMNKVFGEDGYKLIDAFDGREFIKCSGKNGNSKWAMDENHQVVKAIEDYYSTPISHILQEKYLRRHDWLIQNPGSAGCTLSHGRVWTEFLDSGADVAFIAEDDIFFESSFKADMQRLAEFVDHKQASILSTYHFEQARIYLDAKSRTIVGDTTLYRPKNPDFVFSSVGVFVNRAAAESLLENLFPIKFLPDWFGHFLKKGWIDNFWCAYPFLTKPAGMPTTIATHWSGDDIRHTSKFRASLHELAEYSLKHRLPLVGNYVKNRRQKLYGGGTFIV